MRVRFADRERYPDRLLFRLPSGKGLTPWSSGLRRLARSCPCHHRSHPAWRPDPERHIRPPAGPDLGGFRQHGWPAALRTEAFSCLPECRRQSMPWWPGRGSSIRIRCPLFLRGSECAAGRDDDLPSTPPGYTAVAAAQARRHHRASPARRGRSHRVGAGALLTTARCGTTPDQARTAHGVATPGATSRPAPACLHGCVRRDRRP
jgi:hypothetical protein